MNRRVVTAQNHFDSLQTHFAIRLGPTTIITNHHAEKTTKGRPDTEAFGARLKIITFSMLEGSVWFVMFMARNVHLVVLGYY